VEAIRQFEQIVGENIWPKPVQYLRNNLRELTKSFGEIKFGRFGESQGTTAWAAVGL
jgi:hypothetical protein